MLRIHRTLLLGGALEAPISDTLCNVIPRCKVRQPGVYNETLVACQAHVLSAEGLAYLFVVVLEAERIIRSETHEPKDTHLATRPLAGPVRPP
jgi:hypothetical protein